MNTHDSSPGLISPFFLNRVGLRLAEGVATHPDSDYNRGGAPGFTAFDYYDKAMRHLVQYALGCTDEDHLAAVGCNINFLIDIQAKVARGVLPPETDNMPYYGAEKEDGGGEQ